MLELFLLLLDDFNWLLALETLDCLLLEVLLDELSTLELFWLLLGETLLELDFSLKELFTLELFLLLLDDFRLLLLNDDEYLLELEELVPFNAAWALSTACCALVTALLALSRAVFAACWSLTAAVYCW